MSLKNLLLGKLAKNTRSLIWKHLSWSLWDFLKIRYCNNISFQLICHRILLWPFLRDQLILVKTNYRWYLFGSIKSSNKVHRCGDLFNNSGPQKSVKVGILKAVSQIKKYVKSEKLCKISRVSKGRSPAKSRASYSFSVNN